MNGQAFGLLGVELLVQAVNDRLVMLQQLRTLQLEGGREQVVLHGELLVVQMHRLDNLESLHSPTSALATAL